jgi:hypothetical protein
MLAHSDTLSENIKFICTLRKTAQMLVTGLLFNLFLMLEQINYIFSDNVHILSTYNKIDGPTVNIQHHLPM